MLEDFFYVFSRLLNIWKSGKNNTFLKWAPLYFFFQKKKKRNETKKKKKRKEKKRKKRKEQHFWEVNYFSK